MRWGAKAVLEAICPAMVRVATRMPPGSRSAASIVAAARRAALPMETLARVGNRMIGEPAAGDDDGAGSGGAHGRGGDLRDDDGTENVDRIRRLQMRDARAEQLIRSSHDRVVDDQPWCTFPWYRALIREPSSSGLLASAEIVSIPAPVSAKRSARVSRPSVSRATKVARYPPWAKGLRLPRGPVPRRPTAGDVRRSSRPSPPRRSRRSPMLVSYGLNFW